MRLFTNSNFGFIAARRRAYAFSVAAIAIGLVAIVVNLVTLGSWMRYGVDFTGGTLVQVRTSEGVTDADLRAALGGATAPPITRFGAENEFVIRTPVADEADLQEVANTIAVQLEASPAIGSFEIVRTEAVGAKIGSELERRAGLAVLLSVLVTLGYLAVRFEPRFGLAATVATSHDVLLTLGFLALFRIEISLSIVAAVLTIIGYSLNDTIVVFDRIRENLGKKGGRREDPAHLLDRSINETLPRTIMTAATTVAVLVALVLLGGPVIRDFAVVLIVGIVVGTYSSIFVAAPVLLEIQRRWGTKEEAARKKDLRRPRGKEAIPV